MSRFPNRRLMLSAGLGLCAAGLLPRHARACEFFIPTLRIKHPWCRATAPDASTVVVSMRFDEVNTADQLIGVETMVATGAVLAEPGDAGRVATRPLPFDIPAGQDSQLAEEGTHLLLTGLTQPLFVGRAYPMTLRFARGGEVPAQLTVDFPSFRFQ